MLESTKLPLRRWVMAMYLLTSTKTNMAALEARIAAACSRTGRERGSVRLLPVTKTVPAHILRFAHQAGIRSFGENRMQEAMAKVEEAMVATSPRVWNILKGPDKQMLDEHRDPPLTLPSRRSLGYRSKAHTAGSQGSAG